MSERTPALTFNNVTKRYDETTALENFCLTVKQGDFLGLLGPNGAGKTTAMHMATGLAEIDEGSIRVFGEDVVSSYQEARRRIGIAPQEANFDRFFPIEDCLVYQGGYFGLPMDESRRRAEELLEQFELTHKMGSRPNELSGGEKRRLLIAKAVIHDPDIVILDEPTASLDVELRHKLWDFLEALKDQGKTMILTTHYIEEVEKLADRVAILQEGELILSDTLETVMDEYGRFQSIMTVDRLPERVASRVREDFPFLDIDGTTLRSYRRSFDDEISAVLETLHDEDITVTGLKFEETELEDIFLEAVNSNDH
ncbi:MAG: ABC transporter ATP-binding protein [bacterium]